MIKSFKGEFSWLSNFYPCSITLNNNIFPSVEHAYQSEKSDDSEWKKKCQTILKPGQIKKESKKIKINRKEWDSKRLKIMEFLINQKFDQESLRIKLLATNDKVLQEGNNWGDEFWGINLRTGKGLNHLGKLIMKKRDKLKGLIF